MDIHFSHQDLIFSARSKNGTAMSTSLNVYSEVEQALLSRTSASLSQITSYCECDSKYSDNKINTTTTTANINKINTSIIGSKGSVIPITISKNGNYIKTCKLDVYDPQTKQFKGSHHVRDKDIDIDIDINSDRDGYESRDSISFNSESWDGNSSFDITTPRTSVPGKSNTAPCPTTGTPVPLFGYPLLLLFGTINFAMSCGMSTSMSAFFLDWQESFQVSRASAATVHATCLGILNAGAVIPGYLMNRFGARPTLLAGSLLASSGLVLSAFATNILELVITNGLVAGLGFCMMNLPIIPSVTQPFSSYRSITISCLTFGSSIGNAGLSYLYRYLANTFGWRGAFILLGGIALNSCVTGLVITSFYKTSTLGDCKEELIVVDGDSGTDKGHEIQPFMKRIDHFEFTTGETNDLELQCSDSGSDSGISDFNNHSDEHETDLGILGIDQFDAKSIAISHSEAENENDDDNNCIQQYCQCQKDDELVEKATWTLGKDGQNKRVGTIITTINYANNKSKGNDNKTISDKSSCCCNYGMTMALMKCSSKLQRSKLAFLLDPVYILILINAAICIPGTATVLYLLLDFSVVRGFPEESSGVFLLFISFLFSGFGKLIGGALNLIPHVSSVFIMSGFGVCGSLALVTLTYVTEFNGVVATLAVIGLSMGGLCGIYPKCVLDRRDVDVRSFPLALGIVNSAEGLFDSAGPIFMGYLVDSQSSYNPSLFIFAAPTFIASISLLVVYLIFRNNK